MQLKVPAALGRGPGVGVWLGSPFPLFLAEAAKEILGWNGR